METLEYTKIICDVWTYWQQHPEEMTKFATYKRDMSYILYRITDKNYFITKSDSDVINTIVDRLLGVGSDFGYGTGLSETGKIIGSVAGGILGSMVSPFYERPDIGSYDNFFYHRDHRRDINEEEMNKDNLIATYVGAQTGTITSGMGIGYYFGKKIGTDWGGYNVVSSDESIYDMTDTTFINNPNFVFDKLIEIFKPSLKFNRNHLPPLEYIIYVFDLMLNWSQFNAFKTRFVDFGKLYIDPILHRIANPPKPGMVRGVKTLRELSYDTANKNYTYEDIISKIGEEPYLQAVYNFRDVYD